MKRKPLFAAVFVAAMTLSGCYDLNEDGVIRVACLGDSNTAVGPGGVKVCEYLQALKPQWDVLNFAQNSATTCDYGNGLSAYQQLPLALATNPDIVILAFWTNDYAHMLMGTPGASVPAVMACLQDLRAQAGNQMFIAASGFDHASYLTMAPVFNDFVPGLAMDWTSGSANTMLPDGIHVTDAAQQERARRILRLLFPNGGW